MRNLLLTLALLFGVARAATLYQTNILGVAGTPLTGTIKFTSTRSLPAASEAWLIDAGAVSVGVTNGVLNHTLAAGNYTVKFPDSTKLFVIAVPEGTGTYTLEAISTGPIPGITPADVGLPSGGTTGQVLVKSSASSYDVEWATPVGSGDMLQSIYDTDGNGVVDAVDGGSGSGSDLWVNGTKTANGNLLNSSEVTWSVSGTNVTAALASSITRDTELAGLLNEAAASALYQGTNANLTLLATHTPNDWQATNANLTLLQAYGPTAWQATNANLTLWSALVPSNKMDAFPTNNFVYTIQQPLTESQKLVTRQNIGAGAFYDAAGFSEYRGRTNIVFSGPYTVPAGGTGFGMGAPVSTHVQIAFINLGDNARVWNDTRVRQIEMLVPAALPATCQVFVDFWRLESDGRCNLVASTPDLRALLTADDTVQLITIPEPIDVRMGDVTGGHLVYDGANWGAGFVAATATAGDQLRYAYSVTLQDGTPWYADGVASIADTLIPISVYGDAPVFCMFGDSRIDGYPYSNCLTKGSSAWGGTWAANADPASLFGQLTGLSIRNEGRSGFDTGEMEARLSDYTDSEASWYIFCTGFYNDIYASRTKAQFLASCTNIVNGLLATGARVIVVPDFPFKDSQYPPDTDTDIQNEVSDEWMGELEALVLTYYDHDQVLWADTRNYMGQYRPDTGGAHWHDYNRWDLVELFRYNAPMDPPTPEGSVDSLHFSAAGEEAVARAIASELRLHFKVHALPDQYQPVSPTLTSMAALSGLSATVDVLVSGGTTNRLVFSSGILISNITSYHP